MSTFKLCSKLLSTSCSVSQGVFDPFFGCSSRTCLVVSGFVRPASCFNAAAAAVPERIALLLKFRGGQGYCPHGSFLNGALAKPASR